MKNSDVTHSSVRGRLKTSLSELGVKPTLKGFRESLQQLDGVSEELGEQAFRYQVSVLKELSQIDQVRDLLDNDDLTFLDGESSPLDLQIILLPKWLRDYLRDYWQHLSVFYRVEVANLSKWSHDFVVAYMTKSGLVSVTQAQVGPWGREHVTLAPCSDMQSVAISVWNPDDNVELLRTPTWSVADIKKKTGKDCSFIFEAKISYD